MKVSCVYNNPLPLREAQDVFSFAECWGLADAGAEVELICPKGSQDVERLCSHYGFPMVPTLRIFPVSSMHKSQGRGLSWGGLFRLNARRRIKKWKPDWVLGGGLKGAMTLSRFMPDGIRYAYTFHELSGEEKPPNPGRVKREMAALRNMDLIITTTPMLADTLRRAPYHYQGKVEVLPLGVSAEKLPAARQRKADDLLEVYYVGSLREKQGVEIIFEALEKADGVRVNIVGGEASKIAVLKEQAARAGITDRLRLVGWVPPGEILQQIQNADAFVMPSRSFLLRPDAANTKLYQYVTFGRPTFVPDLPQVTQQLGRSEGLVPYRTSDASSLAEQFIRLRDDPSLCMRLSQQIEVFRDTFTWETHSRRLLELFERYS